MDTDILETLKKIALWHQQTFDLTEKAVWLDLEAKMFQAVSTQTNKIEDVSEVLFDLGVLKYRYCSDMADRMITKFLGVTESGVKEKTLVELNKKLDEYSHMKWERTMYGKYSPVVNDN